MPNLLKALKYKPILRQSYHYKNRIGHNVGTNWSSWVSFDHLTTNAF